MAETPAHKALAAATACLLAALACITMFLPPLGDGTAASALRSALFGGGIALASLLHWVFLGIAARRLQRSVAGWVALSLLLFPVGSVAALMLLHGFGADAKTPAAA